MRPEDTNVQADPPAGDGPVNAPPASGGLAAGGAAPRDFLWLWAVAAALAAGVVAWLGGETAHDRFQPEIVLPANYDQLGTYEQRDVRIELIRKAIPPAQSKNAAVGYGLLGA